MCDRGSRVFKEKYGDQFKVLKWFKYVILTKSEKSDMITAERIQDHLVDKFAIVYEVNYLQLPEQVIQAEVWKFLKTR